LCEKITMGTTSNPYGVVGLYDGENPCTFTATAREVISGGEFVMGSGTAGVVGSSIANFATSDLVVAITDSPHKCLGLAVTTAGSNGLVTIARKGTYLVRAGGAVSGGMAILPLGGDSVMNVAVDSTGSTMPIGRALSDGGSEAFVAISLNL